MSSGRESEHVVARLRPHGRALFWPSLLLIAVVGGMSYLAGRLEEYWQNTAVLLGGALLILAAGA